MARQLHRLGRWAVSHRRAVVVAWALAAVLLLGVAHLAGGVSHDSTNIPGVESQHAYDLLALRFPASTAEDAQVVFAPRVGTLATPANRAVVATAISEVTHQAHVALVSPLESSPDGRIGMIDITYDAPGRIVDRTALSQLLATRSQAQAGGVTTELSGGVGSSGGPSGPGDHELYGLLAAVAVLLFAFGSVVAMGLPIATALAGLATGFGVIGVVSACTDVPSVASTLAAMIGLGVGIDYALLVVTRHREHLRAGLAVADAAGEALATAGVSVVFAGSTVIVALCGLAIAGIPFVTSMGLLSGVTVALMVAVTLTLLPALLGFAGHRINRPGRRAHCRRRPGAGWAGIGDRITRCPVPYLAGGLVLLLAMAAPTLGMRLGTADAGSDPPSSTTRRAYDLIAEGFGAGANGPLLAVLVRAGTGGTDPSTSIPAGVVARARAAVTADPDVEAVTADASPGGDAVLLTVIPRSGPAEAATTSLVHRLRGDVLPRTLAGTGVVAYTGGETASYIDLADRVGDRLPLLIAVVCGVSFLLLAAVFRSLLIPLKAAAMNVLSIAAAYGTLVAVFQWGWCKALLGLQATVPIVPFIPMFMFAILFGLSMDYEVFLLCRIREGFLRTGDNRAAVHHGLASTARVITSAALIMISVFGSFVVGNDPTIKMAGFGLAAAVFIDATVVRIVLVPAATALMGRANWWLPGWLDRLLPHFDIEGGVPDDGGSRDVVVRPRPVPGRRLAA